MSLSFYHLLEPPKKIPPPVPPKPRSQSKEMSPDDMDDYEQMGPGGAVPQATLGRPKLTNEQKVLTRSLLYYSSDPLLIYNALLQHF